MPPREAKIRYLPGEKELVCASLRPHDSVYVCVRVRTHFLRQKGRERERQG